MSEWQLKTPVAFIIFNRPDTTARVFAQIAKAKPPKLLVVGDGPRASREGEAERVAATRAIIQQVDWPCEVLTHFSDVNLGCKKRVSSGIDWIFERVEEAIILEDDCLPSQTFFRFCQEMLERYRHDQRVGLISGDNFHFGKSYDANSYYFSKYVHIWGWASWRDRWQGHYDVEMRHWPRIRDEGRLGDIVPSRDQRKYWESIFEMMHQQKIDTWDYQWVFTNWVGGRINIMPSVNLISNIGFGADATHTRSSSPLANMALSEMTFPLQHPIAMAAQGVADHASARRVFYQPPIRKVFLGVLRQLRKWKRS